MIQHLELRRRKGDARGLRRAIRPTPAGYRFLLLLSVVGFAAYNTRNNLLYLMFSIGLATLGVSVTACWCSLARIKLAKGEPRDLYAGTRSTEQFCIRNDSLWLDSYGLTVEEMDFPGLPPRARLPHLCRGEAVSFSIEKVYPNRGVYKSRRMRVESTFPFGLFLTARRLALSRELTVFPQVYRVDISFVFQARCGEVPRRQRGGESEELLRIREYAVGDSFHHIHWKATAKVGKLMVREPSSHQQRSFSIILDNSGGEATKDERWRQGFESSIRAAASLVLHLFSHGLGFRFVSCDEVFARAASEQHLRGVLRHLALLEPSFDPTVDLVDWVRESLTSGDLVLVLPCGASGRWARLSSPSLHIVEPAALVAEGEHQGA